MKPEGGHPREPGDPGSAEALFNRRYRLADRPVHPARHPVLDPFRQWPGVRRLGCQAVGCCGWGPDCLHRAGLTLGERLHREFQCLTARRAPERGDLLHPQASPASHRTVAAPLSPQPITPTTNSDHRSHERPPPVEEVGPPIGGFHPVRVHMRKGELANLARHIGALRRPIPKGRPEPVRHRIDPHLSDEPGDRAAVYRAGALRRKDQVRPVCQRARFMQNLPALAQKAEHDARAPPSSAAPVSSTSPMRSRSRPMSRSEPRRTGTPSAPETRRRAPQAGTHPMFSPWRARLRPSRKGKAR